MSYELKFRRFSMKFKGNIKISIPINMKKDKKFDLLEKCRQHFLET